MISDQCYHYTGDMVKAWLSMNDEDREQAQVKEPTLKTLLQALQDIGCSEVMAQIHDQVKARAGDAEGTLEDRDDANLTKGATSAKEISRWPSGIPKLSSNVASNFQEYEEGKNLKVHAFRLHNCPPSWDSPGVSKLCPYSNILTYIGI